MMSLYCLVMVGLASIPSIPSFKSAEASCPHGFLISQVADFVLTGDQKFAASSCGVSIGIIGISAIDVVNSYWAGHVGFSLKVAKLILSCFYCAGDTIILYISCDHLVALYIT